MFEVGNKVKVEIINTIGEIMELDTEALLVKHNLELDGAIKTVNQWYTKEVCSEIKPIVSK